MSDSVSTQLVTFSEQFIQMYQSELGEYPSVEHDDEWQSECELGTVESAKSFWKPLQRQQALDFTNIDNALEITTHPDLALYYGTLISAGLDASFEGEALQLLQVWNDEDLNMLQQNMISHILMKQKLKQRITLFLAVTDDDSLLISLLNETGEVVLEPVGKEPIRVLAPSLADFIAQLKPALVQDA
ncbi:SecY-interacting protein [Catenovulum sp. SM1970]|uniref:SecY-interacting protein n=1 Tax=Marinifaba aquimaris TaxID=2741323 RepID=UPI001573EC13|nr:SecY-interacting protein [Marinifaba aquimaris]NTS78269.1 SecY-interacting protein [Marinifaba aquimaris]